MSDFQSGAVLDTRPEAEKQKDFKAEEIVASAAAVNWTEKPQSAWRKFPIFNQDGSGSCVAQTEAKELGIMRFLKDGVYVHFSATDIYQRRVNKPAAGMAAVDARDIIRKGGATLEVLTPSQNMTDVQMDTAIVEPYKRQVGLVFAVPNYVALPIKDIDRIASTIQATGKGVMVWFYFKIDEWTERPVVKYPNLSLVGDDTARHSITAVDFSLVGGKKCLIVEDSWGTSFGLAGQRVIDEDFFKARNWYAGYLVNFQFENPQPDPVPTPVPHYVFNRDLKFSPTFVVDQDVKALQDILKYEGLFPANTDSTGYYGAVTARSVLAFQKKYSLAPVSELDALEGKVCGPKTRAKLNALYGQ